MNARLKDPSDLQLLLELEPAHRAFFRNLADTFSSRTSAPAETTTTPGRFWSDVFVETGLPLSAFLESLLWHIALVSVLWTVGQTWIKQEQIQQRRIARESLTYYPPKKFPALGGRGPRPEHRVAPRHPTASPLRVAQEHNSKSIKPPDVRFGHERRPDVMATNPEHVPLFAPKLREFNVPAGPTAAIAPARNLGQTVSRAVNLQPASAVAPASDVEQATARRMNLPQASAIAPAANVASVSARKVISGPSALAVAPAPDSKQSVSRLSRPSMGNPRVVAPSPQFSAQSGVSGRASAAMAQPSVVTPTAALNGSGIIGSGRVSSRVASLVVPPAPSSGGAGDITRGKPSLTLLPGSAVSPPPSMRGNGGLGSARRSSSLPGGGMQIIPPPPSVGSGSSVGGPRVASLAGTGSGSGTRVVPPTASMNGSGSALGRRGTPLSGGDQRAVAPAPSASVAGAGSENSNGPARSLAGGNLQVSPPAAAAPDSGHNFTESNSTAAEAQAIPPPPEPGKSVPASIELPIRVIGMALSLPSSSYFANYEVFIAERRIKKGDPELIKLVYESLPYQPRLADYGLDNSKVYRLRVTRDPTCDETLLQMTWPETDEKRSGSKYATGPPALAPNDKNSLLPCYRTTADDYRIAVTRDR